MRKEDTGLELSRVIFVGRTYDEYVKIFDLTEEELMNYKILDAPAGACSFTSIASNKGYRVTATDIAYFHSVEQLYQKGKDDIKHAVEGLSKVKDKYRWDYFNSIDELEKQRNSALDDCISHMNKSPELYTPTILPELPFKDSQFDMILSAHFLFMYADRLDFDFHRKTLNEMTRVARKEIRIFPLTDLTGNRYEYFQEIIMFISDLGWRTEERIVSYEFQKHANSMLRLYKD
jgi:hypothetical protein